MKKFVFASVMAVASFSLVSAPTLRAQDTISIKDPAEFNAYQMATTQSDPKAKVTALEGFLTSYPQSVVKKAVLDSLHRGHYITSADAHRWDLNSLRTAPNSSTQKSIA